MRDRLFIIREKGRGFNREVLNEIQAAYNSVSHA